MLKKSFLILFTALILSDAAARDGFAEFALFEARKQKIDVKDAAEFQECAHGYSRRYQIIKSLYRYTPDERREMVNWMIFRCSQGKTVHDD